MAHLIIAALVAALTVFPAMAGPPVSFEAYPGFQFSEPVLTQEHGFDNVVAIVTNRSSMAIGRMKVTCSFFREGTPTGVGDAHVGALRDGSRSVLHAAAVPKTGADRAECRVTEVVFQ